MIVLRFTFRQIISQGYNTLEKMRSLSLEQMLKIEGFAEKSSQAFLDSIHRKSTLIQELLKLGIKVKADEINLGEGPLKNLKFCITGELSMGRSDFEKLNGYPNFWAWGFEDNQLNKRAKAAKINIDRNDF